MTTAKDLGKQTQNPSTQTSAKINNKNTNIKYLKNPLKLYSLLYTYFLKFSFRNMCKLD